MKPKPLHIAEALAELGREKTIEAYGYLSAWAALERAAVPVFDIRQRLDAEAVRPTESTALLEQWHDEGTRGLLAIAGPRSTGKTFAAVDWLHARHERVLRSGRGGVGRWLACASWHRLTFEDLRGELERCARAPALVIDDLGAGGTKAKADSDDLARKWINGLIIERMAGSKPTLLLANGADPRDPGDKAAANLYRWLDGRVQARLDQGGGVRPLRGSESLRVPDLDDVDDDGHGRRWRQAREIIRLMGCEMHPTSSAPPIIDNLTGEVAGHGEGPTVMDWRVGLEITAHASNTRNAQAAEVLGLSRDTVRELAQSKADNDRRPVLVAALYEAMARLESAQNGRAMADNLARSKTVYAALRKPVRADPGERRSYGEANASSEAVNTWHGAPAWTQAEDGRAKMRTLGVRVEGQPGYVTVRIGTSVKAKSLPSVERGWEFVAELLGSGA